MASLSDDQMIFRSTPAPRGLAFVDAPQFARNWRVFTMDQLEGLNWDGVIAAGGSVLACATLQPSGPLAGRSLQVAQQLLCRAKLKGVDPALTTSSAFLELHGQGAPGSLGGADIDLWLHGLSAEAASAKVAHIGEVLAANAAKRGATVMAARTAHTFTFFSAYPFRCVQVINALFPAAAAPLLDFDLDCCAMAYDGAHVLALPRALAAVTGRTNVLRAGLESRGLRSFTRAKKYAERGVGLSLPLAVARPVATQANELFSAGKLAMLLGVASVSPAHLATWRAPPGARLFPRQDPAMEPPQTWVTGIMAEGIWDIDSEDIMDIGTSEDFRDITYSAGLLRGDEEEATSDPAAADILAQCALVAALYPAPPEPPPRLPRPDFPHTLARQTDYGEAMPDIPYGPPPPSDTGRSLLKPLELRPPELLPDWQHPEQPRRSPVDAAETGAMLQAHAGERVSVTSVGALRRGPSMFKAACFTDAPPASARHARVAFLNATLPQLSITAALAAPQSVDAVAFGARWRLGALKSDGWLVVRLELLSAVPAGLLTLPLPAAGMGDSMEVMEMAHVLPVNITVFAGPSGPKARTHGVLLDSHAVFGAAPAAPASWSHVIFLDKLETGGRGQGLRVALQAVRVLG